MIVEFDPKDVIDDRQERVIECYSAIQDILRNYGCKLDCSMVVKSDGKIDFDVKVVLEG